MKNSGIKKLLFVIGIFFIGLIVSQNLNRAFKIKITEKDLPFLRAFETDKIHFDESSFKEPIQGEMNKRRSETQLEYRLVDLGGVGIVPDSAGWGKDYSHHTRAFGDVLLPKAPYVDDKAFIRVENEFKAYLTRMQEYGFNGVIFNGFLEFLNFDNLGDGRNVYPINSEYRERHQALRIYFSRLFNFAEEIGMRVILKTDMMVLTEPLRQYIDSEIGGMNSHNKALWQIYAAGFEELLSTFPQLDGLMIRIGEAGSVYNLEGWDYYSVLNVKTDASVRLMLESFLTVAEKHNKDVFFRSWSVGIGDIGDLHVNAATYERVLGSIHSPKLIVSTKYGQGDFYSYLPVNPTLKTGSHKRIIEYQARREFEAFGAFPDYLMPLHQFSLNDIMDSNPNIAGLWLWTQEGGPQRAGPMLLYPFHGLWQLLDVNIYSTAQLALAPRKDINEITTEWIHNNFSENQEAQRQFLELLELSYLSILKGHYIGEFAGKLIRLQQYVMPPSSWHWDIVSGSHSALGLTYEICRENWEQAIEEGFEAVTLVNRMLALIREIDPYAVKDVALLSKIEESINYELNLFEVLAWYRKAFFSYYHWLDTGNMQSYEAWQTALATFNALKEQHLDQYQDHLDFPAYNFFEVDSGFALMERNHALITPIRILLSVLILSLIANRFFFRKYFARQRCANGKERNGFIRLLPLLKISMMLAFVLLTMILSTLFHSFYFVFWSVGSLLVFDLILVYLKKSNHDSPSSRLILLVEPLFILAGLALIVFAYRGPLYLINQMFTNPMWRMLFVWTILLFSAWPIYRYFFLNNTDSGHIFSNNMGNLAIASGVTLLLTSATFQAIGLESVLTKFNNELLLLPLGLSKVLGITTHLNIDPDLPIKLAIFSLFILLIGLFFRKLNSLLSGMKILKTRRISRPELVHSNR